MPVNTAHVDTEDGLRGLTGRSVSPLMKPSKMDFIPSSPASTCCPSPTLSSMSPSLSHKLPMFSRLCSGDSLDIDGPLFHRSVSADDEFGLFELKEESDTEESDSDTEEIEASFDLGPDKRIVKSASGMTWIVTGPSPTNYQDRLESLLSKVQELYKQKTGDDDYDGVDSADTVEEYDLGHNKRVVNSESGMKWVVSGPAPSMSALERQLQEVKDLYEDATGEDVDFEEYDLGHNKRVVNSESGMKWVVSGPAPSMSALERQLQEVKDLYEDATGEDVDFEEYDLGHNKRVVNSETGMKWIVSGPTPTMSSLERQLEEVKEMYKQQTVDSC